MDGYIFKFLCDDISLYKKPEIEKWQHTLSDLISFMLRYAMPMEMLKLSSFKEENLQARNAEEALLASLNACARVTRQLSAIDCPTRTAFGAWISKLQGQRSGPDNVLAFKSLSFLSLEKCLLDMRDLFNSDLSYTNLSGAQLRCAMFEGANLKEANLREANLRFANLIWANLEDANLEDANLEGANLKGASLPGGRIIKKDNS